MAAVPCVVQDPAAALVASYADPSPDARIADLCAAPGGKTLALAARGNVVVAADRSIQRLRLVGENVKRLTEQSGHRLRVSRVQADALAPPVGEPDMLLLDVPCTGTGTLRRNPDIRWRAAYSGSRSLWSYRSLFATFPFSYFDVECSMFLFRIYKIEMGRLVVHSNTRLWNV